MTGEIPPRAERRVDQPGVVEHGRRHALPREAVEVGGEVVGLGGETQPELVGELHDGDVAAESVELFAQGQAVTGEGELDQGHGGVEAWVGGERRAEAGGETLGGSAGQPGVGGHQRLTAEAGMERDGVGQR